MSTQVTITLSDEIYRRVERLAQLTSRDIADVLSDAIKLSIPELGLQTELIESVSRLSDDQVIALTQLQLEPEQDQRLSDLLDRQQEGIITEAEQIELSSLMQVYQEGLLRKATALKEAVQRGLMGSDMPQARYAIAQNDMFE
jgi:predicted DNA-binding protein